MEKRWGVVKNNSSKPMDFKFISGNDHNYYHIEPGGFSEKIGFDIRDSGLVTFQYVINKKKKIDTLNIDTGRKDGTKNNDKKDWIIRIDR